MSDELIEVFNKVCGPDYAVQSHHEGPVRRDYVYLFKNGDLYARSGFDRLFAFNTPWRFWQRAFPGNHPDFEAIEYESVSIADLMFYECMTSKDPEKAIIEAVKDAGLH